LIAELRREAGRMANNPDVSVELYESAFVDIKQIAPA
jgi:hypothetical protein